MTADVSSSLSDEKISQVDRYFLKYQHEAAEYGRGIPSMTVAIIHDQDIAWMKSYGYADLAAKTLPTLKTIYSIGSITKLFTATMLMQLRDAGLLRLDDPVEQYLPGMKFMTPRGHAKPITLRHLATHTSGLPEMPPGFGDIFDHLEADRRGESTYPSIEELLASLEKVPLEEQAIEEFSYSNVGFAVLGHVLERIAGQPYKQYILEHILRPLHMDRSGFDLTDEIRAQMATGYISRSSDVYEVAPIPDMCALAPVGQMYSCAADLARFLALQFRHSPTASEQILNGKTIQEMQIPVTAVSSQNTAYPAIGWWLRNSGELRVLYHGGTTYGFGATVVLEPMARLGIAILMNRAITSPIWWLEPPAIKALKLLLAA